MYDQCFEKQSLIKKKFLECASEEEKYALIITFGRDQKPMEKQHKIAGNIVKGCQSILYLHSFTKEGLVFFEAESEALISSGLAQILTIVYSGETPETILKCPPNYLEDLGIGASLSPSRANGLYSIHLKMKQDALKFLLQK